MAAVFPIPRARMPVVKFEHPGTGAVRTQRATRVVGAVATHEEHRLQGGCWQGGQSSLQPETLSAA